MKKMNRILIIFLFTISGFAQTNTCGVIVNNTFDNGTTLSNGWTEYNTSGRITVDSGKLKFNHNIEMPSAYQTFTPTSENAAFSFDVSASRASVNCQVHLISSTGKHVSSVALGIGTATIKYAATMEEGVPSGFISGTPSLSFPSNTTFTVTTQVDFISKTVDFYNNGVLAIADVPFLEDAEDIAKIDIQLLFMYANNGQFYFDNISLLSGEENRLLLTNAVKTAEKFINSISVGDKYNQYPQSDVDAFQEVIENVNAVLSDCNSAAGLIDNGLLEMKQAQDVFETSLINPPVLKLYSDYGFSGEEHEVYCGYYNGTLGVYDNWAASFTLEKGYMATFAENINGTGFSKVFVASEEDLQINLTEDLYKKVSFIRVGPWRDTLKKGSSGKSGTNDVTIALNTSWFYDWGNGDTDVDDNEYVVMNWGGNPSLGTMEKLGKQMNTTHHLAFNEPDGAKQANMTVDVAIERYATLQASGLRLGAPAVTDGTKGRAWLDEFMIKAKAAGYRIDFIPVHYYKIMTASNFKAWLKDFYDEYQVPIWVTEFNYGDIWAANEKTKTEAQVLTNIKAYCEMMDAANFVERYCIFTWQPSETSAQTVMSVRSPIVLNSVGEFYANHVSPVAYVQEVYEQGGDLSVDNDSISAKVMVYPTVVTDGLLNVMNSIGGNDTEVSIYSSTGQLVKIVYGVEDDLDVSRLSNGVYVVKISSRLGYFTQKIMIQ